MMPTEWEKVDCQLFRFFDFSVEPGRRYCYRVRLVLRNPNYGLEERHLEKKELAAAENVETGWSEPSGPVPVDRDVSLLAGPVNMPRDALLPVMEPNAAFGVVRFELATGEFLFQEFPSETVPKIFRGQLANFRGHPKPAAASQVSGMYGAAMMAPPRDREPETVDYLTDCWLLDMSGGNRLPGKARLFEPSMLLWLDSQGRLVVRNDVDDAEEYAKYKGEDESGQPSDVPKAKRSGRSRARPAPPAGYPGMGSGMPPGMMPGMPSAMPGTPPGYEEFMGPLLDKGAKKRRRTD
jgi:hypothetical protein